MNSLISWSFGGLAKKMGSRAVMSSVCGGGGGLGID